LTPTLITPTGRITLPSHTLAETEAAIRAELQRWGVPLVCEMLRGGATCVERWEYRL
jgi:hypothetical protein